MKWVAIVYVAGWTLYSIYEVIFLYTAKIWYAPILVFCVIGIGTLIGYLAGMMEGR